MSAAREETERLRRGRSTGASASESALELQTASVLAASLAHWLSHLVSNSPLTYAIVAADVALDAVFPFVQSEAVVISASVFASQGRLAIWLILPAAAIGAFVGG